MQKFLQKTFNILKSEETFFAKINIYIIQCDAEIQEVKRITSQEEFDNYIKEFYNKGLGGTDFRPVFTYVDKLVAEKAFTNLKDYLFYRWMRHFPGKKAALSDGVCIHQDQMEQTSTPRRGRSS